MSSSATIECWVEPGTSLIYPTAYKAYRRVREAQEKTPARHCALGAEVNRHVWRRWASRRDGDVDVVLTLRPSVSPRVQRIVSEVLRAIRRGRPAEDAIRHVARRFGLRHKHARAFISGAIAFEIRAVVDGRFDAVVSGGQHAGLDVEAGRRPRAWTDARDDIVSGVDKPSPAA